MATIPESRSWSLTLDVRGEGYFDPRHPDWNVPLRARLQRIAAATRQTEARSRGTRARSRRTPASAPPTPAGATNGGRAPAPAPLAGDSGDDPPGPTARGVPSPTKAEGLSLESWLPNQVAVSVRQLADLWGTTAKAIYHRVARGQLPPPFRLGRTLMFRRADLLRFMSEGRGPSRRE